MQIKWPGFNDEGTLLITLAPDSFGLAQQNITVSGETFTVKDELHVTVIGSQLGLIFKDTIKQNPAISQLLEKTFEDINWSFQQTGPVHILSRSKNKTVQKSIIMLLDMPGVTVFYEQLKALHLIDSDTPIPPAHVTLYTQNCPTGIGVPSTKTLNMLSIKSLSIEELYSKHI